MQYWCIGDDWNSIIGITFEREVSGYLGILRSQNYRACIGNKRKERQVLANRKNNNNELFAEEIGKSSLFILAWWSVIDCGQSTSPVLTYWHNSINLYTISIWVIYCWQLLIVNQIGLWKNYNYHQNQHHWLLLVKSASSTWQHMNHEWHE